MSNLDQNLDPVDPTWSEFCFFRQKDPFIVWQAWLAVQSDRRCIVVFDSLLLNKRQKQLPVAVFAIVFGEMHKMVGSSW